MASKFVFLFLVFFVVAQYVAASPRERRDTPPPPPPGSSSDPDALSNIQNFLKENFQLEKMVDNLKQLGEKIQTGTKEFADTVQQKTQDLFKTEPKKDAA